MPLNKSHRSDYYFGGEDGKTRQFSRKQAGELLADIDEAEDQLRDYYDNADENYQIVEGIILPGKAVFSKLTAEDVSIRPYPTRTHPSSSPPRIVLVTYAVAPTGYLYNGHIHKVGMPLLAAWEYQLSQAGVVTFWTPSYVETAQLLAAIYNNCQKPPEGHTTLQRYIRPRIFIKEQNPFIKALMALSMAYKLNIGEDTATKISKFYSSIFDLAMAEVDEICQIKDIGKKTAEKLLTGIGREL